MTAALEGGEWSAARPGRNLTAGKTRYPFYKRLGGPQSRAGGEENLVSTGIFFANKYIYCKSYTRAYLQFTMLSLHPKYKLICWVIQTSQINKSFAKNSVQNQCAYSSTNWFPWQQKLTKHFLSGSGKTSGCLSKYLRNTASLSAK